MGSQTIDDPREGIVSKGNLEVGRDWSKEMWEMVFSINAGGKSRDMMIYSRIYSQWLMRPLSSKPWLLFQWLAQQNAFFLQPSQSLVLFRRYTNHTPNKPLRNIQQLSNFCLPVYDAAILEYGGPSFSSLRCAMKCRANICTILRDIRVMKFFVVHVAVSQLDRSIPKPMIWCQRCGTWTLTFTQWCSNHKKKA